VSLGHLAFQHLAWERDLRLISDQFTVDEVNKCIAAEDKQAARDRRPLNAAKPDLAPIPELQPPGWTGRIIPWNTLHLLGEAMTPVLVEHGAFELARQWSFYRYFWAFADDPWSDRRLRLSDAAHALVDHHRTLSAEQLGVAFALQLGMRVVRERHRGADVQWVDADIAMDRGALDPHRRLAITRTASRRMRPDYFITARDRGTRNITVYAVEAKGTHGPGRWKKQMAKGARQLEGVQINHVAPTGLVFSTELNDRQIVVRAADPPGGEQWTGPVGPRLADRDVAFLDEETGVTHIAEPAAFRQMLLRSADANLLAFAGQRATAARVVLPEGDGRRERVANAPLEQDDTRFGRVAFTRTILPLGDEFLEVRTGALVEAIAAASSDDGDESADHRSRLAKMLVDDDGAAVTADDVLVESGGESVLETVRSSGTYLRATLTDRR
jgi:hypothetical protein